MPAGGASRVALLRGINVGGARILPMESLRRLAATAGLGESTTVGASGNLLYTSRRSVASDVKALGEALQSKVDGVVIIVREAAEMQALAKKDRFLGADPAIPDKWKFVAFLAEPTRAALPEPPADSPVVVLGRTPREVFYTISEPTSKAIAMSSRLEQALGAPVTVRNWNVVRDLAKRLATG